MFIVTGKSLHIIFPDDARGFCLGVCGITALTCFLLVKLRGESRPCSLGDRNSLRSLR